MTGLIPPSANGPWRTAAAPGLRARRHSAGRERAGAPAWLHGPGVCRYFRRCLSTAVLWDGTTEQRVSFSTTLCSTHADPVTLFLRPVSILHVVAPGHVGGLESVIRLLAVEQRRRGATVQVAAILTDDTADRTGDSTDHPFLAALKGGGVEVVSARFPRRAFLR